MVMLMAAATSFSDMPTLATTHRSSTSTSPSFHRRTKSFARRLERCCCATFAFFPLVFVYGLTTWAVWVEANVSFVGRNGTGAYLRAALGILLYALADISYTIAVFSPPGSPLDDQGGPRGRKGDYQGLPTHDEYNHGARLREEGVEPVPREWEWMQNSVTAKSTGKPRFCKKCQCVKPDRTHHCSTCGQCVLKMDHHCPWLATCVGLRNYKAFLLFLLYTSLFCWTCFGVSAWWVWEEFNERAEGLQGMLVVNTILLSVLAGVIGLVLSGFTAWHVYLVVSGQTTIESLEKTRYLSPLKKSMEGQFKDPTRHNLAHDATPITNAVETGQHQPLTDRLKEIHANALPGVLRPEEGESGATSRTPSPLPPVAANGGPLGSSPAQQSLNRTYASIEAQRERERYNSYQDEVDSERLPNAFDLGWKRNLLQVMGPVPWKWPLPYLNTVGDGWSWEVSPSFWEAKDRIAREREQRIREDALWNREAHQQQPPWQPPPRPKWIPGQGFVDQARNAALQGNERSRGGEGPSPSMQMQPLDRRKRGEDEAGVVDYDTSSDEDRFVQKQQQQQRQQRFTRTENWNDIPEDFLAATTTPAASTKTRRSGSRTKGD